MAQQDPVVSAWFGVEFQGQVVGAFREHLVVSEADVKLLDFVSTPEEAVRIIEESVEENRQ